MCSSLCFNDHLLYCGFLFVDIKKIIAIQIYVVLILKQIFPKNLFSLAPQFYILNVCNYTRRDSHFTSGVERC